MKANELMTFENDVLGTIRGFLDKDGEPWFLAAQVCRCLGIKDSSTAIKQLKQRMQVVENWQRNRATVSNLCPKRARTISFQEGKTHTQLTIIPEQWLYELIFASRKRTAIIFRAWVTGEVLPALRKHGEYRMQGKLIRRSLTDTLKDSGENERMHGHAYSNYSVLVNKSFGLPNKVDRNSLEPDMLEKIARREDLVRVLVNEGKSYQQIKNFIERECIA